MSTIEQAWNDFFIQFGRITIATMIIPVIVALFYKKQWNRPLRVAFIYCLLTFGINLFEQVIIWLINNYTAFFLPYLKRWSIGNTFFLIILYYLKNYLVLGWFYSLIFPIVPFNRYIIWAGRTLALVAIINHCFIEGFRDLGVFNPIINSVFMTVLPLLYLWVSQKHSSRIPLKKNPYFWISLGLLVPKVVVFFQDLAGDYIYGSDFILYVKVQTAVNSLEILGQVLIAIGFVHSRYARFIELPDDKAPSPTPNIGS